MGDFFLLFLHTDHAQREYQQKNIELNCRSERVSCMEKYIEEIKEVKRKENSISFDTTQQEITIVFFLFYFLPFSTNDIKNIL